MTSQVFRFPDSICSLSLFFIIIFHCRVAYIDPFISLNQSTNILYDRSDVAYYSGLPLFFSFRIDIGIDKPLDWKSNQSSVYSVPFACRDDRPYPLAIFVGVNSSSCVPRQLFRIVSWNPQVRISSDWGQIFSYVGSLFSLLNYLFPILFDINSDSFRCFSYSHSQLHIELVYTDPLHRFSVIYPPVPRFSTSVSLFRSVMYPVRIITVILLS